MTILLTSLRFKLVALLAIVVLTSFSLGAQTLPRPDHIVIVVEENVAFKQIIGVGEVAYLNSLANEGALLTNFFAAHHPSQPNYFVLFSGNQQGVVNDLCSPTSPPKKAPSLGGQLISKGLTFIGYSEGLPKVGSKTCAAGLYARKHAPWISFADVPNEASRPFTDFPTNFDHLPTIAFVIPNLVNDMHNGDLGPRRKAGDKWLKEQLNSYKEWALTHNSLLIITWDEDNQLKSVAGANTKPPANHIATILVGQMVKPGAQSDKQYTHRELLRTLQEMYGLPTLPGTKNAIVIDDIWK